MTVSRRNLEGFAEMLSRDVPCYVEWGNGRYTLYAEGGHRELLCGGSRRELFDLMHAMVMGMNLVREKVSREAHPAGKGAYFDRGSAGAGHL